MTPLEPLELAPAPLPRGRRSLWATGVVASTMAVGVSSLALSTVLSRILPEAEYARFGVLSSLITTLSVPYAAFQLVVSRRTAQLVAQGERPGLRRLLGSLAELSDPWQPAVLQLVAATCRGGDLQGRPVGVCGEAASNPVLAAVLVGLGVSSLSMTARAIPDVAALLGAVTIAECREVAQLALAAESAADARAAVRAALPQLDDLGL